MGWSAMADRVLRQTLRTFRQDKGAYYRRPLSEDVFLADVVFDESYFSISTETGAEVSSKRPIMGVRTADLPAGRDRTKDLILIQRNGKVYTFVVTDVQPDGEAGTTLFLQQKGVAIDAP